MVQQAENYVKHSILTPRAAYEERTDGNGGKVFIQSAIGVPPSLDELLALKNDFEITHGLTCKGVLQSRELIKRADGIAIVKDYFDGSTLAAYLQNKPLSLQCFLEIAIKLSQVLGELHAKKIIHKDFNPDNILISENGEDLAICNFSIATLLDQEQQELRLNESVLEQLAYISPEQTGRMNRSVDYRSDLYSLGVTLYQALCRKLPFEYDNVIELIHAHIARYPAVPGVVDKNIPQTVSAIIMKLLSKNAEDRY